MEKTTNQKITVQTTVKAPVDKVWKFWTQPEHIVKWCFASPEWHTPKAQNDLRVGGRFVSRMEARDGSMGFDFGGLYDDVQMNELIAYTMDDGRMVSVNFQSIGNETNITETFEAENENPIEMQRGGWQAIMDSFKKYVEENI
jgi:uncharacterized protein YndB with AHSA1/START domain